MKKNNLKFKISNHKLLKKENIEGAIIADEKLINIFLIKKRFKEIIKRLGIKIILNKKIDINENFIKNYDNIFLCTYDNNNNNLKYFKSSKKIIIINWLKK